MTTSKRKKKREPHGNLLPLGNGDFKDKKNQGSQSYSSSSLCCEWCCQFFLKNKK